MENGAASGGIERDALFNREMRTCWSVREGSTEERGALKAQSGYNSGQGRKEIHSFFRFAPEITFRHLLEKKGEG